MEEPARDSAGRRSSPGSWGAALAGRLLQGSFIRTYVCVCGCVCMYVRTYVPTYVRMYVCKDNVYIFRYIYIHMIILLHLLRSSRLGVSTR